MLDSVGTLVWANAAAESLFGRSLYEAIGVSTDFVHPDDLELALLSLESVQGREVGNSLEIRIRVGDELAPGRGHRAPDWFEDGGLGPGDRAPVADPRAHRDRRGRGERRPGRLPAADGLHDGVPLDATATAALLVSRRLAPAR